MVDLGERAKASGIAPAVDQVIALVCAYVADLSSKGEPPKPGTLDGALKMVKAAMDLETSYADKAALDSLPDEVILEWVKQKTATQ